MVVTKVVKLIKKRILLIEDDGIQRSIIRDYLLTEDYQVLESCDGEDGLRCAIEFLPDLVIVDWMLPRMSGVEFCRKLRELGSLTPIVLLTSKHDLESQIGGLSFGADDYWVKPVPLKLIKAKVEAILRRRQSEASLPDCVPLGSAVFYPQTSVLSRDGRDTPLNPKESGILCILLMREGVPVTRERLLASVWGYEKLPTSRTVDNYVVSLRRKLQLSAGSEIQIETKRGVGYQLLRSKHKIES